MTDAIDVWRVGVPTPIPRLFDYLPPPDRALPEAIVGCRVRVRFGGRTVVGLVLARAADSELPLVKLKRVSALLDDQPVLPAALLTLLTRAADYYRHPLGDAALSVLPALLRAGEPARRGGRRRWRIAAQAASGGVAPARAPRQAEVLARLRAAGDAGLGEDELHALGFAVKRVLKTLAARGWATVDVESYPLPLPVAEGARDERVLNPDQAAAEAAVTEALDRFQVWLLDGVTGSGKTEVYLRVIRTVLARGGQVLVLVPEIGLTPQLVRRLRRGLATPVLALHSAMTDRERLDAWLAASGGEAGVLVGTRSALYTPLPKLALIVVDEEHDSSFKQQEGFRYCARDMAVLLARQRNLPVLLGSATPSLETLHNVDRGRYRRLALPRRAGAGRKPRVELVDVRALPLQAGLSSFAQAGIGEALAAGGQVLVFLNRRGYAPSLQCHRCGWVGACRQCDAHLVVHQADQRLRCHHCGADQPLPLACPACGGSDISPVGHGTERLAAWLAEAFPEYPPLRIDRDATRRKGALAQVLEQMRRGEAKLLIGTQMLAKGHHAPGLSLVVVVGADAGLFGADFRSPERLAQLLIQVAGRAGRAQREGRVLIQTHQPEHPMWSLLIGQGYGAFARHELAQRRQAGLPPHAAMALLRADAEVRERPMAFLQAAAQRAAAHFRAEEIWGPAPAAMERRGGRYRACLTLVTPCRARLHQGLAGLLQGFDDWPQARRVRWSLDVDPVEVLS